MKKHGLNARHGLACLPALAACAVLLTLCVANIRLPHALLRAAVTRDGVFLNGINDRIAAALQSDDLWGKNAFVNLNGLFARWTGREECNRVSRMTNGMLNEFENSWDLTDHARAVAEFDDALRTLNIPLLFVQAPGKMSLDKSLLPAHAQDFSNENADQLLSLLQNAGVKALDLRPSISATADQVDQYFYRTDHHWTADGAFVGFQAIVKALNGLIPGGVDPTNAAAARWVRHTVPGAFLGSQGKRVGVHYAGVDDLIYYTPAFATRLTTLIPHHQEIRRGGFEEACIWPQYLEEIDYFRLNNYFVYYGGDYPVMELINENAPVQKTLLFLKDSFSVPVLAYLHTVFARIEAVDPRYYADGSIMALADALRPDAAVLMLNPSTLGTADFFTFGCGAWQENRRADTNVVSLYEADEIALAPEENPYHSFRLPVALTSGRRYTLTIGSARADQGRPAALMAGIYAPDGETFLLRKLWPLNDQSAADSLTWVFSLPPAAAPQPLEFRLYAGISGQADGVGVTWRSMRLTEEYPRSGLTALYAQDDAALTGEDHFRSARLPAALTPGKAYCVTAEGIEGDAALVPSLTVSLYDVEAHAGVYYAHWPVGTDGGKAWRFTVPEGAAGCRVQFSAEGDQAASLRVLRPVIWEVSDACGTEIFQQAQVLLPPSGNAYHAYSVPVAFQPGRTYTVRAADVTATAEPLRGLTLALYNPSQGGYLARTNWYLPRTENEGDFEWTFTLPRGENIARDTQLLLYAGWAGEAQNKGVAFTRLSVHQWPEAADGDIVYARARWDVEPNNDPYHCAVVPAALLPGHTYRVTIQGQKITAGSAEGITVKLHSDRTGKDLMDRTWPVAGDPAPFSWVLTIPDTIVGQGEAALQLCAGLNGQTAGVGVQFSGLVITEILSLY
ncbi:MAG: hypothetical protein IJ662_01845 [Clostridia bacterium]|nr:hypothetical protein [Clostridia bacterium]